jgi:hypothetical protein
MRLHERTGMPAVRQENLPQRNRQFDPKERRGRGPGPRPRAGGQEPGAGPRGRTRKEQDKLLIADYLCL